MRVKKGVNIKTHSYIKRCIFAFLLICLAITLTQLITQSFIQLGLLVKLTQKVNIQSFLLTIIQQSTIFSVLAWWFQKKLNSSFFSFDGDFSLSLFTYSFLGLIGVNLVSSLIMKYMSVNVQQLEILDREGMKQNSHLFLFVVAFIAPLYEEFVFRGVILKILYSKVEERLSSPFYMIISILISGILFSLVHFDLDAALPVFMLGSYFAWITIKTNSIFIPTLLHFIQNFISGCLFLNDKLFQQFNLSFF